VWRSFRRALWPRQTIAVSQLSERGCGAAALATVFRAHGVHVSLFEIERAIDIDGDGASLGSLIEAADRWGFDGKGIRTNRTGLGTVRLPAIAHLRRATGDHYVVVEKTWRNGDVLIADPATARSERLAAAQFEREWTGVALVLAPRKEARNRSSRAGLRLSDVARGRKRRITVALGLAAAATALSLLPALYLQYLIDTVIASDSAARLWRLTVGVLALCVLQCAAQVGRDYVSSLTARQIDAQLQNRFARHLLDLPVSFHLVFRAGDVFNRFNEVLKVRGLLTSYGLSAALDAVLLAAGIGILVNYNMGLACIALIALPLFLALARFSAPATKRLRAEAVEAASAVSSNLTDFLYGITVIKAFGTESVVAARMERALSRMHDALYRSSLAMSRVGGGLMVLTGVTTAATATFGCLLVLRHELTVGALVGFFGVLGVLLAPAQRLAETITQCQDAFVARDRVGEVLAIPTETTLAPGCRRRELTGDLRFEHVGFGYQGGRPILEDIDLSIPAGARVGLLGVSGCGKTTLLNLLLRFHVPSAGCIRVDGVPVGELDLLDYRRQLALVPQDCYLLTGTIRDNVLMGRPGITDEQLDEAIRVAGLLPLVGRMRYGMDTPVGERGALLSGGERQRVAVARALAGHPRLLLLDEPTSALDTITELAMLESLISMTDGATVLVASHCLSTVASCDLLAVIQQGRIVEYGRPRDLLAGDGLFRRMMREQLPFLSAPAAEKDAWLTA